MTIIGVDPSINSTGVCIKNDNNAKYYNIVSKMTKKMQQFESPYIKILRYNKSEIKDLDYTGKEIAKTNNIYNICQIIGSIMDIHKPDKLIMEGVSYSSNGSVVDLAGLNYCIRLLAKDRNINIEIVSPTSVKKFATGNGQAEKDIMIDAWKRLDKNISNVNDIKIDDLADSYFLASFKNDI